MSWDVAIAIGLVGITFTLFYVAMNLDKIKHGVLQVLFFILGLYAVMQDFYIFGRIAKAGAQTDIESWFITQFQIFMWVVIFIIMYLLIVFIIELLKSLQKPDID